MIKTSSLTFLLMGLPLLWHAVAQEPPAAPHASLTLVNAVPSDKNVYISFDGQTIWPPGFTSGQSTGAVMFPSGTKQMKIECEGYAPTEAKIDLPPGANCAMIVFPGEVITDGPDKGKRKISVFLPKPHQAGSQALTKSRWKAVLVGTSASQEVEINGKKMVLEPRKSSEFAATAGGATVRHQGKELLGVAVEDVGEYWVVIFLGDSSLQAALLTHSPFKVPAS
jgi:hypothetical protein